jgi:predicted NAD/FAD-binding protein
VAGLSAAWLLGQRHRVSLFEKNDYFGGHTHTIEVDTDRGRVPVDTGFIVYNEPNYPHLTGLLRTLGVETRDTDMSFGVSVGDGRLEYAGTDLGTLFAQRSNVLRPGFLGMLGEILRFNREVKGLLARDALGSGSLGDFLLSRGYGRRFRDHYLLPMAAAIWSCPALSMLDFPLASFARFFHNHGLLDLRDRPQWKTVVGGSHQYPRRMLQRLGERAALRVPATAVSRREGGVEVRLADGRRQTFHQVVLACHADEALRLLSGPTSEEVRVLSRFGYQPNRAVLHSDPALMPRSRRVWSSWNYISGASTQDGTGQVSVSYWMNRLQGLHESPEFFVSLNPLQDPDPATVHAEMIYEHPVFDQAAMEAQTRLPRLQGRGGVWLCGSYWGYGFHEDALRSAVDVAEALGCPAPWSVPAPAVQDAPARPVSPLAARWAGIGT